MKKSVKQKLGLVQSEGVNIWNLLRYSFWRISPQGRENQAKLRQLNGEYPASRCFVMGNGPSLLKCDLTLLKDELTVGSNAQYLIWDSMGFTPNFLTVEDRLVAEDRASELCAMDQPLKVFPRDLSYCLGESKNTVFINFVRGYKPFPRFSSDFEKVVYWGGTVSFLNLQLAYYLGCKEIYLIGFDHYYQIPDFVESHVITSQGDDVNHVHADYFGKGFRWHDPNLLRMEQAYLEARRFLEANGVKVFNATVGGHLEVFERVDYAQIFDSTLRDKSGR